MQHVLLLRHGQTDANAAGIIQGHLPTSLNALGRQQAELLGARLATFQPRVTRLIASPLIRAMQTAEPIARMLGLRVEAMEGWTERYFGSGQGKPANLVRVMTHGGQHIDPPDAEPRDAFDLRVAAALNAVDPAAVTAIVSHGGTIGSIVRQIMDGRLAATNPPVERLQIPNCAILHLSRPTAADAWTIECANDVAHLHGLETDRDVG